MTDARLREALSRAADDIAKHKRTWETEMQYLAGWAEAVEALDAEHESRRCLQNGECGGEFCTSCKAITKFCVVMLGERDV